MRPTRVPGLKHYLVGRLRPGANEMWLVSLGAAEPKKGWFYPVYPPIEPVVQLLSWILVTTLLMPASC